MLALHVKGPGFDCSTGNECIIEHIYARVCESTKIEQIKAS
jgi:hypothetical protein